MPWVLSNGDGLLRKTDKPAALARVLQKNMSPADAIPQPSTCIIDQMSLHGPEYERQYMTFVQLADTAPSLVLHWGI